MLLHDAIPIGERTGFKFEVDRFGVFVDAAFTEVRNGAVNRAFVFFGRAGFSISNEPPVKMLKTVRSTYDF